MKGKKAIYVIFILIQSLVYGIGNPITKIAYQSITPLWLLAIRFTMASVVLSLFLRQAHIFRRKKGWHKALAAFRPVLRRSLYLLQYIPQHDLRHQRGVHNVAAGVVRTGAFCCNHKIAL